MKKLTTLLTFIFAFTINAQTTLTNKLRITGSTKRNTDTRVLVQDSITKDVHWILKSSFGGGSSSNDLNTTMGFGNFTEENLEFRAGADLDWFSGVYHGRLNGIGLTANRNWSMFDANGYVAHSVNSIAANAQGDIVLPLTKAIKQISGIDYSLVAVDKTKTLVTNNDYSQQIILEADTFQVGDEIEILNPLNSDITILNNIDGGVIYYQGGYIDFENAANLFMGSKALLKCVELNIFTLNIINDYVYTGVTSVNGMAGNVIIPKELPDQSGNANKVLSTNGTTPSWTNLTQNLQQTTSDGDNTTNNIITKNVSGTNTTTMFQDTLTQIDGVFKSKLTSNKIKFTDSPEISGNESYLSKDYLVMANSSFGQFIMTAIELNYFSTAEYNINQPKTIIGYGYVVATSNNQDNFASIGSSSSGGVLNTKDYLGNQINIKNSEITFSNPVVNKSTALKTDNITGLNNELQLPNGSGSLAKSVNGEFADVNGNITIPSFPTIDPTPTTGSTNVPSSGGTADAIAIGVGKITVTDLFGQAFTDLASAHAWLDTYTDNDIISESFVNGVYKFTVSAGSNFSLADGFCNSTTSTEKVEFQDPCGLVTVLSNDAFNGNAKDNTLGNCSFGNNAFADSTGNNTLGNCSFGDNAFGSSIPSVKNTINKIISCGIGFAQDYTGRFDINFFGHDGSQNLPNDIFTSSNLVWINTLYSNKFIKNNDLDEDLANAILNLSNGNSGVNFELISNKATNPLKEVGSKSASVTAVTTVTVTLVNEQPDTDYIPMISATSMLALNGYISAKTITTFTVTFATAITGTVTFNYSIFHN